jgi:hypothetical protein
MSKSEVLAALSVSLTKAIDEWMQKECREDAWGSIGYVGDDLCHLMAKAAMAVLEGSADVQDYLQREKLIQT